MADICKAGDPVKWSTLYNLMQDIMQGATAEYSDGREYDPDYNKILDEKSPFYLPEVYAAAPALHMSVAGSTVTGAYLVETPGDTNPWDLPEPLKTLAEQDRLYFVAEPDGCFCKSIWKVTSDGSTLQAVDGALKMACQSITVPDSGTSLPCDFVPNAAWTRMQRRAGAVGNRGEQTWTELKCVGVDGLLYKTSGRGVVWIQRSMEGYFTWTIAQADFNALLDAMYNVFIEWPCGYEKSKWWHHYDKNGTPGAGKKIQDDEAGPVRYDNWLYVWAWTAKLLSTTDSAWSFANKPGCLELVTSPGVTLKLPWEEATCGDNKRCPDQQDKLLVRCATLRVLDALVKRLKKTIVRTNCTASLRYYYSYQQGNARACALGVNPDGNGYYTVGTATNSCSPDFGIHYQDCDIKETMSGGVRSWGGTDPEPPYNCTVEVDDGCEDLHACNPNPGDASYETSGGDSAASVLSAARGAAKSAGWVDGTGTVATMTVGNGTVNGNPFYAGQPFIVGTGTFSATGGPTAASFSSYRLYIVAENLPSGHVFRITVSQYRNAYDEFGSPVTELLSRDTVTIGPGETYQEELPEDNGVFLIAEVWHDKAPTPT